MDDSLYSDSAGLQGSSQGTTAYGPTSTRFMHARNLFDESMDLDEAGTQDTDIPDEHSELRRNDINAPGSYQHTGSSEKNGQVPRLPSSELGRIQLHGHAHTATAAGAALGASSNPSEKHDPFPSTAMPEDNNDLPTVPPLSAEERRQQALTRERDDLAKMNTLLEHAIASISRTVPKMEVSPYEAHQIL